MPLKSRSTGLLTADEWLDLPDAPEDGIVFGNDDEALIESSSKNLIEGPPKNFKTALVMSLLLRASKGETAYSQLPLYSRKPRHVLYLHGELSKRQIRKRTAAAARGMAGPFNNFLQVRDLDAHLINNPGQTIIKRYVQQARERFGPAGDIDVVFDPWQSFIKGHDENNFMEISKATGFIDQMIVDHRLTVWIPTHTGKDGSRGTRGHSSINGWRDALIKTQRKNDILTVTVEPRWAAPQEPFTLRFDDGQMISSDGLKWSPRAKEVREVIGKHGSGGVICRATLGSILKLDSDQLRKLLYALKRERAITYSDSSVTIYAESPLDDAPGRNPQ